MKLIITGANGFIGSVLTKRAVEEGHDVWALDNGSRGRNPINAKTVGRRVRYIQHDCKYPLSDMIRTGVDAVIHLAAGTGSLDRPIEQLRELNVEMTKNALYSAHHLGAKVFAFPVSSLKVGVPDSAYVISKQEALAWLHDEERKESYLGPDILPLTFVNVIGAYKGFSEFRKNEVHILPKLAMAFKRGTAFMINGTDYLTEDGTPSRDYIHVLDVADYLLYLVEAAMGGPIPRHEDGTIWLGTGRTTTVSQVIRYFRQFVGSDGLKIEAGNRRRFDVGEIRAPADQVERMRRFRPQAPAWVGIRDEVTALLQHKGL